MTNLQTILTYLHGTKNHGHNTNKSIFFEKYVLYSYGYHFPMCLYCPIEKKYFVNSTKYSRTTTQHKNLLLNYVLANSVVYMNTRELKQKIFEAQRFINLSSYKKL